MTLTPEQRDGLRRTAKAATQGTWSIAVSGWSGDRADTIVNDDTGDEIIFAQDEQGGSSWGEDVDAAHIAAFDPPTVLALLDALDTAEAGRDIRQERVAALTARVRDMNSTITEWGQRLVKITGSEHLVSGDGDADWGVIWERAGELGTRAASAEESRDVARARTRGAVSDYEEQCRRADNAEEAMTAAQRQVHAVRALHQPYLDDDDDTICRECSYFGGDWGLYPVEHPCPTIRALDGAGR